MSSTPRIGGWLALLAALSCGGGGGGGGGAALQVGLWQYEPGSYSFVNCYFSSTQVPLYNTGFQLVAEGTRLLRINPDGCRFTIIASARHGEGVQGEQCTVTVPDIEGHSKTIVYTLNQLLMDLRPSEDSLMQEVFGLRADNKTSAGSYTCEITGSNLLHHAP